MDKVSVAKAVRSLGPIVVNPYSVVSVATDFMRFHFNGIKVKQGSELSQRFNLNSSEESMEVSVVRDLILTVVVK